MRAKQSIRGVMEREGSIITEVEPCMSDGVRTWIGNCLGIHVPYVVDPL